MEYLTVKFHTQKDLIKDIRILPGTNVVFFVSDSKCELESYDVSELNDITEGDWESDDVYCRWTTDDSIFYDDSKAFLNRLYADLKYNETEPDHLVRHIFLVRRCSYYTLEAVGKCEGYLGGKYYCQFVNAYDGVSLPPIKSASDIRKLVNHINDERKFCSVLGGGE